MTVLVANNLVLETAVIEITLEIFSANVCSLLPSFYLKEEHGLCIFLVQSSPRRRAQQPLAGTVVRGTYQAAMKPDVT